MNKDQVTLDVKSGWKIYQSLAGLVALAGIIFLTDRLISVIEYTGAGAIFLLSFFVVMAAGILYSMMYSFRHRLIFDESSMRRRGIINEKVIPYQEISELRFSDSFWKTNSTGRIIGDSSVYLIDSKYKDPEKAKAFLQDVVKLKDVVKVR